MITVYLDSNDYSNFATARPNSEAWEIKKQFLKYKKTGKVVFVFSVAGVAEAVPIGLGLNHPASYERLMTIEELCGTNSLKSIFEAIEGEVLAGIHLQPFCAKGAWLPSDFNIGNMVKEIADLARQAFCEANSMPSSYKFVFDHHYRGQPEYRENVLNGFFGKLNLSKAKRREVLRMPKGSISLEVDLDRLIKEAMLNKSSLAEVLKTESQMAFFLSSVIRSPGEEIANAFNISICEQELIGDQEGLLLRFFNHLAQKIGAQTIDELMANDIRARCPGFSLMTEILTNSALERSVACKDFVSNQAVDAIHAFYAPYVDLFKADKYTTRIIKDVNPNINVYSSLTEINEELQCRLEQ